MQGPARGWWCWLRQLNVQFKKKNKQVDKTLANKHNKSQYTKALQKQKHAAHLEKDNRSVFTEDTVVLS